MNKPQPKPDSDNSDLIEATITESYLWDLASDKDDWNRFMTELRAYIDQYAYEYAERVIGPDLEVNDGHRVIDQMGEDSYCGCVVCDYHNHANRCKAEQRRENLELSSHEEEPES